MDILILLGLYVVLAPIIFFIINSQSINSVIKKNRELEEKIANLETALYSMKFKQNVEKETKKEAESVFNDMSSTIASVEKNEGEKREQFAYKEKAFDTFREEFDVSEKFAVPKEEKIREKRLKKEKIKSYLKEKTESKSSLKSEKSTSFIHKIKENMNAESIIGKLGALLLLVGIAFVYKYAYDNGYINQNVSIIMGYVVSMLIFASGIYFVKKDRIILAQILIGTAFTSSYITTYSAYLYYGIIGDLSAFLILAFVSLLIFAVSFIYNFQTVIIMASVMSVSVPFLVNMGFLGIMGLGLYLISLSLISTIIYYIKKWHILQISNAVTVLLTLFGLLVMNSSFIEPKLLSYLIIIQSLILLLPDMLMYSIPSNLSLYNNDKIALKSSIIQAVNFLCSFLLLGGVNAFSNHMISYIMMGYTVIYAISIYMIYRNAEFKLFLDALYIIATISLLTALYIRFVDMHFLGLIILAVSVMLALFDTAIKKKLTHYISIAVYSLSLVLVLLELAYDRKLMELVIILAVNLAFMVLFDMKSRISNKRAFRLISYQVYMTLFINAAVFMQCGDYYEKIQSANQVMAFFLIANLVLFIIYQSLNMKYKLFDERNTLFVFLAPISILSLILFKSDISNTIYGDYGLAGALMEKTWNVRTMLSYLFASSVVGLFGFRSKNNRWLYSALLVVLLHTFALAELSYYFLDLRYGILLSSLLILAHEVYLKKYRKEDSKYESLVLIISKYVSIGINLIYFIFIFPVYYMQYDFDFLSLLINSINMKLLSHNLKVIKSNKYVRYAVSTVMILYLSYVHVYIPTSGNHYLSLIWAAYVVGTMIYYLRKSDVKMVNLCLASLVLIVAKFVIIDLSTASLISKVLTSIGFGVALLLLSYMMPKLMNTYSKKS